MYTWENDYVLGGTGFDFWQGYGTLLFSKISRLALVSTQPPIQWLLVVMRVSMKSTANLYLVTRFRMSGAVPILPLCASTACKRT